MLVASDLLVSDKSSGGWSFKRFELWIHFQGRNSRIRCRIMPSSLYYTVFGEYFVIVRIQSKNKRLRFDQLCQLSCEKER